MTIKSCLKVSMSILRRTVLSEFVDDQNTSTLADSAKSHLKWQIVDAHTQKRYPGDVMMFVVVENENCRGEGES